MQVHDLGPLWVESDGLPVPLNGQRMASALSALLVHLNEKVRTDVLIQSVWGDQPSSRAPAALDTLLWRLRRVLDPGRPARASSTVLRTEEHGYRLVLPVHAVDSRQFQAAARTIAARRSPLEPVATLELTAGVLSLWHGRPYDDVQDATGWLEPHRTRLLEQHLTVQQAHIGALLDAGRPEQAVAELLPLLQQHPFVERLWCYRILGLYRSGRPAAALDAYADVAGLLDRELGMPPGPDLTRLHRQVLRHDRSLAGPPRARAPRAPVHLPRHRTTLIGRATDVAAVAALVDRHRLVCVTGPVGCGKTRLAAAVAEQVQGRFPDGVFFADLSDVTDPGAVADRVQETLRIDLDPGGSAVNAVARYAASRELLIILDNCEQLVEPASVLVDAVLARGVGARMLITSRRVLAAHDEVVYRLRPLPVPRGADPSDLRASPAAMLFVDRVAGRGIPIDIDGPQGVQVARICRALDGLPLSLELAAASAQVFQLHEIADRVAEHPLALGGRAGDAGLRDAIESGHGLLTERQRVAHRRLSVLPPRFTLDAAVAACAGEDLPTDEVATALIGLVGHSLLDAMRPERPNGPSLFRQLVPVRAHAAGHLAAAGETESARAAVLGWVLATVAAGPRLGQSDGGAMDRHFEDNRRTITAALESAISDGPDDEVLIALCRLVPYWWLDGKLSPETVRLLSDAATAPGGAVSDFVRAAVLAAYGSFLTINQQAPMHPDALIGAIQRLGDAPSALTIFAGELLLSIAAACWVGGNPAAAEAAAAGVARYGDRLDDDHLRVLAKAVRCAIGLLADPPGAAESARSVLAECESVGNSSAAIMCCHTLYMAALFTGDGITGLRWNTEALRLQQEIGQRNAANTLEARGSLHLLAGNVQDAIRCYGSAHLQYSRLGRSWPQIPGTEELLATARSEVTHEEFDQAWASGERLAATDLAGAWT